MSSQSREEIALLISRAGKYELVEENNQGMNAYAFKAKHMHLNRDVFLKIYDASSERADIFGEPRFLVEATRGTHSSSHLVNVLDAEKLSDEWVLVAMELVDGGSILDAIEHKGLPLMDAIRVTKGILHGLSHLHDARLAHRDIKPANIMLSNRNGGLHPKLGDFGSVARLDNPDAKVRASRHSVLYVPPEGWQNPSEYGIRSDIYQVGMVMAELINGPLPYGLEPYLDRQAKDEVKQLGAVRFSDLFDCDRCLVVNGAIARRAASRKILSFVSDQPYMNRTLKQVINKATHPDYNQRYSSAMDMCNALNNLHFPNWKLSEKGYSALCWQNWDWLIETIDRRTVSKIHIKRSRYNANSFRFWREVNSLEEAFCVILKEG